MMKKASGITPRPDVVPMMQHCKPSIHLLNSQFIACFFGERLANLKLLHCHDNEAEPKGVSRSTELQSRRFLCDGRVTAKVHGPCLFAACLSDEEESCKLENAWLILSCSLNLTAEGVVFVFS